MTPAGLGIRSGQISTWRWPKTELDSTIAVATLTNVSSARFGKEDAAHGARLDFESQSVTSAGRRQRANSRPICTPMIDADQNAGNPRIGQSARP